MKSSAGSGVPVLVMLVLGCGRVIATGKLYTLNNLPAATICHFCMLRELHASVGSIRVSGIKSEEQHCDNEIHTWFGVKLGTGKIFCRSECSQCYSSIITDSLLVWLARLQCTYTY